MRLLVTLLVTLVLVVCLDQVVPRLLTRERMTEMAVADGAAVFGQFVRLQLQELRDDVNVSVARIHTRWAALPDTVAADELRVALIGNSTALFAVVPGVLEERFATALPGCRVSVLPLLFPAVTVADEGLLVDAALAKHAAMVVVFPNLKGLVEGESPIAARLQALFGHDLDDAGVGAAMRGWLDRHWETFRQRHALRQLAVRTVWPPARSAAGETDAVAAALRDIAGAAGRGDMDEILATYRRHRMRTFVGTPVFQRRLSPESPVFGTVAAIASTIGASDALGVAVFLPVNPVFRDPRVTDGFPRYHLDDAYTRALAARVLETYASAGLETADRLDALPAQAFIDLVHVNGDGTRAFTDDVAGLLLEVWRRRGSGPCRGDRARGGASLR